VPQKLGYRSGGAISVNQRSRKALILVFGCSF
jgi:hypothetical protein